MTKFPTEQAFPRSASEKSRGVGRVPVTAKKKKKANIPSWEERPHLWREKLRAVLTEQIQIPVKVERECFVYLFIYLFTYLFIYLFIYFWLCWVFVSVRGLSPVAASGGHSSSRCAGLSR